MAIDVSALRVGPGYLYDPVGGKFYQGASQGSPMAPTGDSAYDWRTQDPNYGSQLWGASPGSFGNYGVGSTQYNFANGGGGSGVGLDQFTNIPANLQGWFSPGTNIQAYDRAPQATQVTQAPEESFLSSFMQGPMSVIGPALGISGFMNGFGGNFLQNLFNGGGSYIPGGESALAGNGVWSGGAPIGAAGAAANGGSGMWDFLDNLFPGESATAGSGVWSNGDVTGSFNPLADYGPEYFNGASDYSGAMRQLSELGPATNLQDKITAIDSAASKLGINPMSLLKMIGLTGASGDAASRGRGGIFDQIGNDPLGAAFNSTPFLLALSEANSQGKDLNGVLNSINGDSYRQAVLDPYDLATGQGRTALQQSLSDRGVAGSSFGYNDLGNYDYMRNLGRGDLASKASIATAGLQGQLINQRNTNRNLLLGAGLNASGRLFQPQSDPFGLGNIGLSSILGGV